VNRQAQIRKMQAHISQPQRRVASFGMPTESGRCASCLPLRRPEAGPSHGGIAGKVRTIGEHGSPALCFCSRIHGKRQNTVPLLSGCIGILRSMRSRQVFPSSANSPVFSLLTSGHSLGACPAPGGNCAALLRSATPAGQVRTRRGPRHYERPAGFGFRKIFCAQNAQNIFQTLRKSAACPWERGTLASLRARVSRRQSGQIQTGEKQWHFMETTSR
jgi:hypothetical protein